MGLCAVDEDLVGEVTTGKETPGSPERMTPRLVAVRVSWLTRRRRRREQVWTACSPPHVDSTTAQQRHSDHCQLSSKALHWLTERRSRDTALSSANWRSLTTSQPSTCRHCLWCSSRRTLGGMPLSKRSHARSKFTA